MLAGVVDILFPPVCPLCSKRLIDDGGLCLECASGFRLIEEPFCTICGDPFPTAPGGNATSHPCTICSREERPFALARSAVFYDGAALDAIHRFKYHGDMTLAKPLSAMLARTAGQMIKDNMLIMPVPLHRRRLKERGFNQALVLARGLSKAFSLKVDYTTLRRTRETTAQIELSGDERRKNVKGAFELRAGRGEGLKGRHLLLVDDVHTTGSTISECAKVLKRAGGVVFAVTLARAGHP